MAKNYIQFCLSGEISPNLVTLFGIGASYNVSRAAIEIVFGGPHYKTFFVSRNLREKMIQNCVGKGSRTLDSLYRALPKAHNVDAKRALKQPLCSNPSSHKNITYKYVKVMANLLFIGPAPIRSLGRYMIRVQKLKSVLKLSSHQWGARLHTSSSCCLLACLLRDHCILGQTFNTLSPHIWCICQEEYFTALNKCFNYIDE